MAEAQAQRREERQEHRYREVELPEEERVLEKAQDTVLVRRTERELRRRYLQAAKKKGIELSPERLERLVRRRMLRWIHFLKAAGLSDEKIVELFNSDIWNKNEGKKAMIGSVTFAKIILEGKLDGTLGTSSKRVKEFLNDLLIKQEERRGGGSFAEKERLKFEPGKRSIEEYYPQWRKENAAVLERMAKNLYNGDFQSLSEENKEKLYLLIYEELWSNYLYGNEDIEEQQEVAQETRPSERVEERPAVEQKAETQEQRAEMFAENVLDRVEKIYGSLDPEKKKLLRKMLSELYLGKRDRVDFGLVNRERAGQLLNDSVLIRMLEEEGGFSIRKTKDELEGGKPGVSLVISRG